MPRNDRPGKDPNHAMREAGVLERMADPRAEIPGMDPDERERAMTGIRHANHRRTEGGHELIEGAPVMAPREDELSPEVAEMLRRSREKQGRLKGGIE